MDPKHPFSCEVIIPNPNQPLHDVVSRWSDTHIHHPAIVVKATTEADITTALTYAKQNGLTVLVAAGGHGSNVPVTSKTLYLDISKFNTIELDKAAGTVTIGGGATTGQVIQAVTSQGYYTLWPNSNAVGYVGCVLGGGSNTMNGMHGFEVDAVEAFNLITAEGEKVHVSPSSARKEQELFNVLCGAGFGYGVITSVIMKASPLSELRLEHGDCIWQRRLVFPPTKIKEVTRAFTALQDGLPPQAMPTLICARSPPSAPRPGSPIIMLLASYYGPASEAEKAFPTLFDEGLTGSALSAETTLLPFGEVNTALKPFSAHGGHKEFSSILLPHIAPESIQQAVGMWIDVTEKHLDARPTTLVFNLWDNQVLLRNGESETGRNMAFARENRKNRVFASAIKWCTSPETKVALDDFGDRFLQIARGESTAAGTTGEGTGRMRDEEGSGLMPSNVRLSKDLAEIYKGDKVEIIRRVKREWDPKGLFWSPGMDVLENGKKPL